VSAASVRSRLGDLAEALPEFAALIDRWRRSNNWTQQWVTLRNLVESLVRLGEDEVATVLHAAAPTAGAALPAMARRHPGYAPPPSPRVAASTRRCAGRRPNAAGGWRATRS
jgi:hypothetical protein